MFYKCTFLFPLIVLCCCTNLDVSKEQGSFPVIKGKKWPKSWHTIPKNSVNKPVMVMTTWAFTGAALVAWNTLSKNGSALHTVLSGCDYCERMQCDFTVGFGGSPDENGETTLDAMIIDGNTLNIGAVGGLKRIRRAIWVANAVMQHSKHTILVGEAATQFAKQMGFHEGTLNTNKSVEDWENWKKNDCQPNFWKDVIPDSKTSCGPYSPAPLAHAAPSTSSLPTSLRDDFHHDTIGQIAMDANGSIAAGLSSNGANHKIPGRMGDAAVPGAGGFADSDVGAAAATGDGDIMMRFSPSSRIVEKMRNKMSPQKAVTQVIKSIREKFPDFKGGLIAFDKFGNFGAACNGIGKFPFTVARSDFGGVKTFYVKCIK